MTQQPKEVHYVIVIEGHGDMMRTEEIKSLKEAREIASILGGKVGIREGKWRHHLDPTRRST